MKYQKKYLIQQSDNVKNLIKNDTLTDDLKELMDNEETRQIIDHFLCRF